MTTYIFAALAILIGIVIAVVVIAVDAMANHIVGDAHEHLPDDWNEK